MNYTAAARVTRNTDKACWSAGKSRVTDQARLAVFNYKPLRRRDQPLLLSRFRAPEATLTTIEHLSPWLSVTKIDFSDPGDARELLCWNEDQSQKPRINRSLTEACFGGNTRSEGDGISKQSERQTKPRSVQADASNDVIGADVHQERDKLPHIEQKCPQSPVTGGNINRKTPSLNSQSTEKRVKIADIKPAGKTKDRSSSVTSRPNTRNLSDNIKAGDSVGNYYTGYLPPDVSSQLSSRDVDHVVSDDAGSRTRDKDPLNSLHEKTDCPWKPLIGDRSKFIRQTYPIGSNRPDIDQIRFAERRRLLQANNQAPGLFSVLKGREAPVRPDGRQYNRRERVEEAFRMQNREAKSGARRRQNQFSSIEQFQAQREKTYHLQGLAREMLNK